MDRKDQIEKIVLKEIHDIQFMKKIKNINTIHEAKKGARPVMTGKFGANVEAEHEKAKQQFGKLVNPDAVPSDKIAATKVYNNAGRSAEISGDAMDDSSTKDFTTNQSDAEEDAAARKALDTNREIEKPRSQRELETQARAENKHNQIVHHVTELGRHIPAFAQLGRTRYNTKAIFDAEPEEVTAALKSAEKSHPHLNTHISSLKSLLGM
jgi:hypothetical protein